MQWGISKENILVTGNTVIDALHFILNKIESDQSLSKNIVSRLNQELSFDWQAKRFYFSYGP